MLTPKVMPDFASFCKLARKGNLVPIYTEFLADTETPVSAAMKLDNGDYTFLLESVEGNEKWATYSFLGIEPRLIFSCKGQEVAWIKNGETSRENANGNPLLLLKKELEKFKPVAVKGVPRFHGGAVGYIGYDCVRYFEDIPDRHKDHRDLPDALFMVTDSLIVFNNIRHQIQIIVNAFLPNRAKKTDLKQAYDKAVKRLVNLQSRLASSPTKKSSPQAVKTRTSTPKMRVARAQFIRTVEKAKKFITDGDIIQVVLSNAFEGDTTLEPFQIYRALRMLNPSPYMYYLRLKDFSIVGSSPETLVRLEEGEVTVRPIAGTRPRGKNEKDDQKLAQELLADPKERAEHVMLVDLGRNDVGRIAQEGSVKVNDLMKIERYSHVMHITSSVHGLIEKDKDAFDVLGATFPAGTLSGAPKIRAMEIIDELETFKRGPYGGALGYFSFSGNMDFCITIRTLLLKKGRYYVQAGAGIVADSKPTREFDECVNKAKAVLKALDLAKKI